MTIETAIAPAGERETSHCSPCHRAVLDLDGSKRDECVREQGSDPIKPSMSAWFGARACTGRAGKACSRSPTEVDLLLSLKDYPSPQITPVLLSNSTASPAYRNGFQGFPGISSPLPRILSGIPCGLFLLKWLWGKLKPDSEMLILLRDEFGSYSRLSKPLM